MDLINRQDAIYAIEKLDIPEDMCVFEILSHIELAIGTLPSAERKRGEWIFNPSDAIEAMFTKPKCSECGFESADGGNYCQNCGADMRDSND